MKTKVIKIAETPITEAAQIAAEAIQAGKLVGFPTETVYGIAVDATNFEAVARLRELKSRPTAPFSVHVATASDASRYIKNMPNRASWLMDRAWPGPATLLVQTGGEFADPQLNAIEGLWESLTLDGVLGLRCPDEVFTQYMLSLAGVPVIAPSANLQGEPSPKCADDVLTRLDGKIDLLIDTGKTKYGQDSSIVKFDGADWTIIRQGVFNTAMLQRMMTRKIAFVCTGNTCRSPMAEGIAKRILAARLNCPVADLAKNGVEIISAGAMACDGDPATHEAVVAAANLGADIANHKSQRLTPMLTKTCDLIFCMTDSHRAMAQAMADGVPPVVTLLDNNGIPDPFGGDLEIYNATAKAIEDAIIKNVQDGKL